MPTTAHIIRNISAGFENEMESNLNEFSLTLTRWGRAERTVKAYLKYLGMVANILGKDPATWAVQDCTDLILSDKWEDYAEGTQNAIRASLKAYWEVHCRDDLLGSNNRTFFKTKRHSGGKDRYDDLKRKAATEKEVSTILEVCRDSILTSSNAEDVYRHTILYFIAGYGIRCVGMVNMRLCDVDPSNETINVYKSKGSKSREIYADIPIREIFPAFIDARFEVLENLSRKYGGDPEIASRLGTLKDDPEARLFFSRFPNRGIREIGQPLTSGGVASIVKHLSNDIVGRRINPHAFRHAKVFYLLNIKRLKIEKVARYMGHDNIQTTMDYEYLGARDLKREFAEAEKTNSRHTIKSASTLGNELDDNIAKLKDLHDQGILNDAAFGAAVAELLKNAT